MLSNINKKRMVQLLSQCLSAIGFPDPGPLSENVRMWSRDGLFVSMLEPGVRPFTDLINLIEKQSQVDGRPISEIFSQKHIQAETERLIGQLVVRAGEGQQEPSELEEDQIRKVVDKWLRGFETPSEVAAYYTVIGNLIMEAPVKVGRITLSPLDDEARETLLSSCSRVIGRMADTEEVKEQFKRHVAGAFQVGQGRVVAQGTVSRAEPRRAQEIFRERVREVLHVLRFFGYFIHPPSQRLLLDLIGRVYLGQNVFLRLVPDNRISLTFAQAKDPRPYELTGKQLQHLKKIGLPLMGDILAKEEDDRAPLENSCVNAITWISRALEDDVADSRFLKLCIAMESLLLRRSDQPFRQIMAERVAFLLGQGLAGRLGIVRDVKKIYDVRSAIAHEGHSPVLEEWLGKTEFYSTHTVLGFIQLMRKQGWSSVDDFINWLDKLKFA